LWGHTRQSSSHHGSSGATTHASHHVHSRRHPPHWVHGAVRGSPWPSATRQRWTVEGVSSWAMLLLRGHAKPRMGGSPSAWPTHSSWRQHGVETWPWVHGWTKVGGHIELGRATWRKSTTSRTSPATASSEARHPSEAQLVMRSGVGWRAERRPPPGLPATRSSRPPHEGHSSTHPAAIPTTSWCP